MGTVLAGILWGIYYIWLYEKTIPLVILFTNDIHGHILEGEEKDGSWRGGFPAFSSFLKKEPLPYILLDGGDFFQGTPEANFTKGRVVVELMNYLGYHATVMGNHEFDYGVENLENLANHADFTFLSSNLKEEKSGETPSWAKPYIILELAGIRVGIIGISPSYLSKISIEKNVEGMKVENEIKNLLNYLPEVKENADIVIALTHLGLSNRDRKYIGDIGLAGVVDGLDFIIGGHSHTALEKPVKIEDTHIFQSGSYLKSVGRIFLRVHKDKKRIVHLKYKLIPLYVRYYPIDSKVMDLIRSYAGDIYDTMEEVIGEGEVWLGHRLETEERKHGELSLGNLVTDIMRDYTKTDFAFQNIGGIRSGLPKGEIKLRHVHMLSPFGNHLVKMELTGKDIKELMEQSVSGRYGILQVSGLKVIWDSALPRGRRVLNVLVGGKNIEEEQIYSLTTNNFLDQGGDGFDVFSKGENKEELEVFLREIEIEYIRNNSPITAKREGRIINVNIDE